MSAANAKMFFLLFSLLSIAFAAEPPTESPTSTETPTTSSPPPPTAGHSEEKGEQPQKSGEGSAVLAVEHGPSEQKVSPLSAEKSKAEESGSAGAKSDSSKTASPSSQSSGAGSSGTATGSAEVGHSSSAEEQQPANGVSKAFAFPLSALFFFVFTVCVFML